MKATHRRSEGVLLRKEIPVLADLPAGVKGLTRVVTALEHLKAKGWSHAQVAVPVRKTGDLKRLGFTTDPGFAIPLPGEKWLSKTWRRGRLHVHRLGPFYLFHQDKHAGFPRSPADLRHIVEDVPPAVLARLRWRGGPLVVKDKTMKHEMTKKAFETKMMAHLSAEGRDLSVVAAAYEAELEKIALIPELLRWGGRVVERGAGSLAGVKNLLSRGAGRIGGAVESAAAMPGRMAEGLMNAPGAAAREFHAGRAAVQSQRRGAMAAVPTLPPPGGMTHQVPTSGLPATGAVRGGAKPTTTFSNPNPAAYKPKPTTQYVPLGAEQGAAAPAAGAGQAAAGPGILEGRYGITPGGEKGMFGGQDMNSWFSALDPKKKTELLAMMGGGIGAAGLGGGMLLGHGGNTTVVQ